MADLIVTAASVALVESPRQPRTIPAGAAVDAGAPVYLDSAGKVREASAGADATEVAGGIAVTSAAEANLPVTVAGADAIIDLGNALGGLAYGATIFLSNTAGNVGDAAGSASVVMGTVIPAWGATTADKLLRLSGSLLG